MDTKLQATLETSDNAKMFYNFNSKEELWYWLDTCLEKPTLIKEIKICRL